MKFILVLFGVLVSLSGFHQDKYQTEYYQVHTIEGNDVYAGAINHVIESGNIVVGIKIKNNLNLKDGDIIEQTYDIDKNKIVKDIKSTKSLSEVKEINK